MARRSAALIGPGSGPSVRISSMPAQVQVRGLGREEFALVVQKLNETDDVVLPVHKDGTYDLIECPYVCVSYEGGNRGFIACILFGG